MVARQVKDPAFSNVPGADVSPDGFYRALLHSPASFAIIATDPSDTVIGWNPGAAHLFGWTAAEAVGQPFARMAASAAGPAAPPNVDQWYARKDGSHFWGRGERIVLHRPDSDSAGVEIGAITLLRDRTGQRERTERQRLDAEFLRGVLAASGDCIKVLDLDGTLTFMSEGGQRVMEVSDFNAIRGCPWPDFWQNEANHAARSALDAARHGRTGRFQGQADTFAGNPRYWDVQVTPILGADGKPERLLSVSRDITTTRLAELALQQAESLNTLILKSSRDCIVVLDLEGHTQIVSPGGIEAMEIADVDAIIGLSWLRVWRDNDAVAARAALAAARAGGTGRFQGFCPTHRGTPKWWDVVISPLAGPDGTPERLVSIGRDVTAQVRAQEDLRFSEESHRLAVEAADVGTWDLDLQTDLLTWSDRTKAMFGISPGVPCSMADFYGGLHPEDRAATSIAFASALDPQRRATYDVEYRTIGKEDGKTRWVAAKGRGIFDQAGTCIRALGTAIDITARKVAEARQAFRLDLWDRLQALSDPRAIMACAVEALGTYLGVSRVGYGLVQPDDETVVLDTSYVDGVERLTGAYRLVDFGPDDIARQRRGQVAHFADCLTAPNQDPAIWAAIQTRAMVSVPLVRDGRLRASLYVNHVDPRDWPDEDLALIADIAQRTWDAVERARAETALREANDLLEQRIAAALQEQREVEEKLRQSQKMEAVGQLTGGIAHDFNNLLTGIMGSLELIQGRLQQGRLSGLDAYAAAAQGAARRAAALTHRLLAFSRRQTLDPKPTDVNRLVAGMEDLLRRSVGPSVAIEVVHAVGLWGTLVDPPQLESALLNLCINARDAMPGGGRLTIETANTWIDDREGARRDLAPGQYVALSVTDTGTGMSPEVAKRAFDPFFTTKPIGQGTGLGLSMIYGFARQSGGDVRIHTEPGQGTTVRIHLPRHHTAEVPPEAPPDRTVPPRCVQGRTVLVVDDEPTVRTLVTEVLHDVGCAAIEANDGPEGLRILRSGARIDLLITDVGLPGGMNGRQVADAARLIRPGLQVLFITGYAENAAIGNGHLEPGMQVLIKPFSMEDLGRRLHQLL